MRLLMIIGPGLLVAATGVGAGDLATAAFTGSELGAAVLWAVAVGALLKFSLTEGLARWQLATGTTLLEGLISRLGVLAAIVFLVYLLPWSFVVGSALISACGVTAHAALPVFEDARVAKVVFGIAQSALGVGLVLAGGFRLFEKVMGFCIGLMFVTVMVTAGALWPGADVVLSGFVPDPQKLSGRDLEWTVALIGGVGGTLTILCYGYWIREESREGEEAVPLCRIDLAVGYVMTAAFGMAMVIIGSNVDAEGRGADLVVELARSLEVSLGPVARWLFLLGAWGAVFSSLLGVWQAVPYLFADFCIQMRRRRVAETGVPASRESSPVDTKSLPYRAYLFAIATIPIVGVFGDFKQAQKLYAVVGAFFLPLLALALLIMNGRADWVGDRLRNRWPTAIVLLATLVFFSWVLWEKLRPS